MLSAPWTVARSRSVASVDAFFSQATQSPSGDLALSFFDGAVE